MLHQLIGDTLELWFTIALSVVMVELVISLSSYVNMMFMYLMAELLAQTTQLPDVSYQRFLYKFY
jgi:hypothetical protein